jgi:hypothetical protein
LVLALAATWIITAFHGSVPFLVIRLWQ